jgi:type II secretory ATPase GspE/PulE/Tfp pilus assembly ATPase PilB-like protein
MESHTEEIVLEVDATPESEALPAGEAMVRALPFSFAKRHGVLIRDIDNGVADAAYRTGTSPLSLAEARRFAGMPLRLTRVSSEAFDSLLQQTYEQGSQMAMQMVGDLDEHTDLLQVAQELPEPSDLLESDDDAPIIRFINAVLTEAIKDNASDVHIEPYENRLGVRFRVDGVLREVLQRAARGTANKACPGTARRLTHQGDVETRYRREAAAAGWSYITEDRRASRGRPRIDDAIGSRRTRRLAIARQAGRTSRSHVARHG